MNIVDTLAGGDVLKWEAVWNLDMNTVLAKCMHDSTHARYREEIEELRRRK